MKTCLFPDTTVLVNFALVHRLDLLREYLGDRGRVVEAVAREIIRSSEHVAHLAEVDVREWFGAPLRIEAAADIAAVEITRTARFGGRRNEPLKHLGESQTIQVLRTFDEFASSSLITDDRAAYDFARRSGLRARHTLDILSELVAFGDLSTTDAFRLTQNMEFAGRTLLAPVRDHSYFRP